MPEGAHGIDSGGTAGWKIASQKSQRENDEDGRNQCEWIDLANAEKKALQPTGSPKSERQADEEPENDEQE